MSELNQSGPEEYADPEYMRPEHLLPAETVMQARAYARKLGVSIEMILTVHREAIDLCVAELDKELRKCPECGETKCEHCAQRELERKDLCLRIKGMRR